MKQRLLKNILRFLAARILKKYRPLIIGVTGSVGKSSTKEAIAIALSGFYRLAKSEGNYNNEYGLPLTIIGAKSGGNSVLGWARVFWRGLWRWLIPGKYPQALVLEFGIDRPGDMAYLLSFVPVDIGVVTHVSGSHLEYFKSLRKIANEKSQLVRHFENGKGIAILNADNELVLAMREKTNAETVLTYGLDHEADLRGIQAVLQPATPTQLFPGYHLKISYEGKTVPIRLPFIVAKHHLGAVLAALAVVAGLKGNLIEAAQRLEQFAPLPGRLRFLPGFSGMRLLDDTYNSSPASLEEALNVLKQIMAPRKVAVLGDMLELGEDSIGLHRELASAVRDSGANLVMTVGRYMRFTDEELEVLGFPAKQHIWFETPLEACTALRALARADDVILIKGSQGMRLEMVTKTLLVDPELAETYLCRQDPVWLAKPFVPPAEWQHIQERLAKEGNAV